MSQWGLVVGGVCETVVTSATQPTVALLGGQWAQITGGAGVGWTWADGTWTAPPAVGDAVARHITPLAFRQRFTAAERVALEIAALDDPAAGMPARQAAAALRSMLADVVAARYIDLDRADTRAGVQQLESLGLLAGGRALEILDAPAQAHELP